MRVFIGWPYDATWVKKYIVPLVASYGVDVDTGEEVQGARLGEAVTKLILDADAAIFIAARRQQLMNGRWLTSDWVSNEFNIAENRKLQRVYVIREADVEFANPAYPERQYGDIPPADAAEAMLLVAKAVGQWTGRFFKLQLMPQDFIGKVKSRVRRNDYSCKYTVKQRGRTLIGDVPASIEEEGQGLFVYLENLPVVPDAYLQLTVEAGEKWNCSGVPLTALEITLEKEEP